MKKIVYLLLFWGMANYVYAQQYTMPAESPRQMVEQQFSYSKIVVDYGRPAVKGRKIFGGLVPYNEVWRAGANSCTKITFGQSIVFGGKVIPAGTYGLFVIPSPTEWKVILNKDFQQWGAFNYDARLDVAQMVVPVQTLNTPQEWLEITINPTQNEVYDLIFKWDTVMVKVPLKVANVGATRETIQKLKEIKKLNSKR